MRLQPLEVIMFIGIKFLTGPKAQATFLYKNEDLFKLSWRSQPCEPLHLTDLKEVEVLSPGFLGVNILIKCIFITGDEELAEIDYATLHAMQVFLFNKNTSPVNVNSFFPKRRESVTYHILRYHNCTHQHNYINILYKMLAVI